MYRTLVDVSTLTAHLSDREWIIVDCRFDLMRPEAGRERYLEAHIPGAIYAHLGRDLSGPALTDCGRHPLPAPQALAATFGRLGIDRSKQVVGYDDASGSIAARLWWLLQYMEHEAVAVLDGGWQAWLESGAPTVAGDQSSPAARFEGRARDGSVVLLAEVPRIRLLVDARDPARYRGETEPLDPRAGHIPGAYNRFWRENIGPDGRFRPATELKNDFEALLDGSPPEQLVSYCGSGVTACHNLLAMTHAGLPAGRLYAGSWSEWCADPARPIATHAR